MAEQLFWKVMAYLQSLQPAFGKGRHRLARRFRRTIHVVDSTTVQLVASCLDWAKHRRRKAAAKCHLRLDLQSLLPRFAIVDTAGDHDNARAREVCAGIRAGEIVLFDRAYLDFTHLFGLLVRGIFWVTRTKENVRLRVVKRRLRRVTALVQLDGKDVELEFLTNNFTWAASTVADLYHCRWQIEVFFKQIKQTLQLCDFLGHSANAVRWQVWSALLLYLLLRFHAFLSGWHTQLHPALHSCPRGRVGPLRPAPAVALLWDSAAALAHARPARPGASPRLRPIPCGTASGLTQSLFPSKPVKS